MTTVNMDNLLMSFNNINTKRQPSAPSIAVTLQEPSVVNSAPPTLHKKRSFLRRLFGGRPSPPPASAPTVLPSLESASTRTSTESTTQDSTVEELGGLAAGQLRQTYMQTFDFTGLNILMALRKLCSRLEMKGETQQLDRVLDSFSERWVECNPRHGFKHATVIHTICYSLFLLNTDIYLFDSAKKMSKQQYLNNTWDTIVPNLNEDFAECDSARSSQDTIERRISEDRQSLRRPASFTGRRSFDNMTLVDCPSEGSINEWKTQLENVLKDFYDSIRRTRLPVRNVQPLVQTPTTTSASKSNLFRRSNSMLSRSDSFSASTILTTATSFTSTPSTPTTPTAKPSVGFAQALGTNESLALAGAPWAKEGPVTYMTKTNHGKRKPLFAVVDKDQLRIFDLSKKKRRSLQRGAIVGGGNWRDSATEVMSLSLCHAQAVVGSEHYFRVILPNEPTSYFFGVTSHKSACEFVDTINYWAARVSKVPMRGSVGNMEYGFSTVPAGTKVYDWSPPLLPMGVSESAESAQLEAHREHLEGLRLELTELESLTRSPPPTKGWQNWCAKSAYLQKEIGKFALFVESLTIAEMRAGVLAVRK